MYKYRVVVKIWNSRFISDYLKADNEKDARRKAFVHVVQKFKSCRCEFISVGLVT